VTKGIPWVERMVDEKGTLKVAWMASKVAV
jgi:hypothetical protein